MFCVARRTGLRSFQSDLHDPSSVIVLKLHSLCFFATAEEAAVAKTNKATTASKVRTIESTLGYIENVRSLCDLYLKCIRLKRGAFDPVNC